jgi:hypothetical protein
MRRLDTVAPTCPRDSEAEVRLEIRGILVGVSFDMPPIEFSSSDGGQPSTPLSCYTQWFQLMVTQQLWATVGFDSTAKHLIWVVRQ